VYRATNDVITNLLDILLLDETGEPPKPWLTAIIED
jgi:hypothetical protein